MLWCLGMFSSASTWMFNVMQQVAASVSPTPPHALFLDFDDPLPAMAAVAETLIVKTHGSAVAQDLARLASGVVITIRDPRDAVVSLMSSNRLPFEIALRMTEVSAWTCAARMSHPRSLLFRFEDRFFEDPATIERIAALFPTALPQPNHQRIFTALQRQAVDAFIAGMDTDPTTHGGFNKVTGQHDVFNVTTGWHRHHAGRKAEVGRWHRDLSEHQLQAIEHRLRPWMERVGYDVRGSRGAPYRLGIGRYGVIEHGSPPAP